ncbi:MAG: hypothetical protein R6W89_08565 [Candidatus Hydrogenedentota bacterium]
MATISQDPRERIVAAYDGGAGTRRQIAERYNVSLGMVKKLLQQRRRTDDIRARHHRWGRKPKLTPTHRRRLVQLVELRDAIGVACSLPAIHYALVREGLSLKKTLCPSEQDRRQV